VLLGVAIISASPALAATDLHLDPDAWRLWFAATGATLVTLAFLAIAGAVAWWRARNNRLFKLLRVGLLCSIRRGRQ
jgi:hypothetical protein